MLCSLQRLTRRSRALLAIFAAAGLGGTGARAQTIEQQSGRVPGLPQPSIGTSLPHALADPGEVRSALARRGIIFGINYIGEVFANPTGGMRQSAVYDGRVELEVQADLGKSLGLRGLTFFANGYQIHGQSISAANLGVLMPVSFIEADPATRLSEVWLEQKLFEDRVSIRIGQLAADTEFMLSEGGAALLNGTWGWPSIANTNMPGNGPGYPLASPGVRIAFNPNDQIAALVGVFNGNPAGDCPADQDPQECNPHGLLFPIDAPPLLMAEGAYSYNQEPGALAGTIKLGGYRNFGAYEFQQVITGGVHIGFAGERLLRTNGDFGFYAVLDQMIYRLPGEGDPRGIAVFGRVFCVPEHNPLSAYWEAGVTFDGLHRARPDDTFAIGFAYSGISPEISDLQKQRNKPVIASFEAMLEASYTAQIVPGFTVQPDFQYFWNPGGNSPLPNNPNEAIPNAAVLGVRTSINY